MVFCVFQANSLETKQNWVKKMRELIQERILYMHEALKDKQPTMFKPPPKMFNPSRVSRYVGHNCLSAYSFCVCIFDSVILYHSQTCLW